MQRMLAPMLAGVAALGVGLVFALAEQSDQSGPVSQPSPAANVPIISAPYGALSGEVVRGPTCAGPGRPGQVCEEPAQATIDVRDQSGQVVAHFQSDPAGRFVIPLPPGTYAVEATKPGVAQPASDFDTPSVSPGQVVIADGVTVQVRIDFDTGIR